MNKILVEKFKNKKVLEYISSSKFWKPALGIIIGGTIGFAYYSFVGCSSGSCTITSNPYLSILFGGFFGFAFVKRPCAVCK
jgi:hypothetical protein